MNDTLQFKVKDLINEYITLKQKKGKINYELELRLGSFSNNNFESNVPLEYFNSLKNNKSLFNNSNVTNEVSIVLTSDSSKIRTHVIYDKSIKKNTFNDKKIRLNKLDIELDDVPVSVTRLSLSSEEITKTDSPSKSQFRFKNRVSKISHDLFWRFDFTETSFLRSNNVTEITNWKNNCLSGLLSDPHYEVELELISDNLDPIPIYNSLHSLMSLLFPNSFNIQKFNDLVSFIRDQLSILHPKLKYSQLQLKRLLSKPIALQKKHISTIKNKFYSTTAKADGLRAVLFTNNGLGYLLTTKNSIVDLGPYPNIGINLFDGEFIEDLNLFLIIDVLIFKGDIVTEKNLLDRHNIISDNISLFKNKNITIEFKKFEYIKDLNTDSIFDLNKKIYNDKYKFNLDGLIFTPILDSYYNSTIYKWKPQEQNTIDFLLRKSNKPKVYDLYVGANKAYVQKNKVIRPDNYSSLFPWINYNSLYLPILFCTPEGNTFQFISNDSTDYDSKIVELSYNPKNNVWELLRIRDDKTLEYQAQINYGNDVYIALDTWTLINNPITEDQILGNENIELGYFQAETTTILAPMKRFHNIIKADSYERYCKNDVYHLELGGGRYNDINKWINVKIDNVIVVDIDNEAIKIGMDRYNSLNNDKLWNCTVIPVISDFIDDSLRTSINVAVEVETGKEFNSKEKFDSISCHFAIHYVLNSPDSIKSLYENVNTLLKPGGKFIITCFNGKRVIDLLNNVDTAITLYKDSLPVFIIKKGYTVNSLLDSGQRINVYVESLGGQYDEYLVNFDYITKVFKNFSVIEHIPFQDYYSRYSKEYTKKDFEKIKLSESESIFSFLNDIIVLSKN